MDEASSLFALGASKTKTVLVLGATGAHGVPAIEHLLRSAAWQVIVVTSSASSTEAQALKKMGCTLLVAADTSAESLAARLRHGMSASAYSCYLVGVTSQVSTQQPGHSAHTLATCMHMLSSPHLRLALCVQSDYN